MPTIAIVTGEPSGDRLGAALMRDIKAQRDDVDFVGIGGDAMQEVGMESVGHSDTLTLVGLDGIFGKLREIVALRRKLLRRLDEKKPSLYIGIDAPDFNLEVERRLKVKGVKVGHYVAPSVWAWRAHRIPKIKEASDFLLGIYPFEVEWFAQYGITIHYVGHPILSELNALPDRQTLRQNYQINEDERVVTVLIGSRKAEIQRMGSTLINVANELIKKGYSVHIPMVSDELLQYLKATTANISPAIKFSIGNSRELLALADYGIIKSGTSSLEAALLNTPHLVVYKASWLSYRWIKAKSIRTDVAMPNIMLNRAVVPELLQYDMTEDNIMNTFDQIVTPENTSAQQLAFAEIRREMTGSLKETPAQVVLNELDDTA